MAEIIAILLYLLQINLAHSTTRKSAKTIRIIDRNNFVFNSVGIYQQTIFIGDTIGIYHPCHNHRELQKNYHPCHNHRRIYSVGVYRYYYRRNISVGILQRVLKYLPSMPQSPTAILSVITVATTNGIISSVKFSREFFFLRTQLSVRPSVFGFFISDRISDGTGNYRRSIFRRTYSVGKNFTDKLRALHQRNESVSKTV